MVVFLACRKKFEDTLKTITEEDGKSQVSDSESLTELYLCYLRSVCDLERDPRKVM